MTAMGASSTRAVDMFPVAAIDDPLRRGSEVIHDQNWTEVRWAAIGLYRTPVRLDSMLRSSTAGGTGYSRQSR